MAEREQIKVSIPNSPACGQWETLLVDALDGLLRPEDEATFSNHMATCPACEVLFEQARQGREWLEFLAPEPAVPAYLLDRILIETGHGKLDARSLEIRNLAVAGGPADGVEDGSLLQMPPVWQQPGFAARMRRFAEPRLLMTAAMAFFSIALTLSMTGVKISIFHMADLRPTSVRSQLEKRIMTASTPIIRYYDHLRFVYEVESRMRELRKATESEQKQQRTAPTDPGGETRKKDGGTQLEPAHDNPKDAPQQTVNPPATLGSDDLLEARLEIPSRNPSILSRLQSKPNHTKGLPTGTSDTHQISGQAMPDRSTTCIA